MCIHTPMRRRWIAAAALAAASACGSTPTQPPRPAAAPQIFCPADVVVKGITGGSQPVTYSAPTVTDGTAPVNVSCSKVSGSSFPLGTSTVSCTATDAQSRQAACSFKVTVSGLVLSVTKYEAEGDSLTEGENALPKPSYVDPPNAYPAKLQAIFDATYPGQNILVINKGHGGDLVETTVESIPGDLRRDKPGAVLLLTGYNNLLNGGCRVRDGIDPACGKAIDAVEFGVRDCIRHSKEGNVSYVFVSTLTPPGPLAAGADDRRLRDDVIRQLNARIKAVVAAQGVTLVDTYPTFVGHEAEYVSIDGLHLRPAGYQAIADAFFAAIKSTIPQTTALASVNGLR
jgi:lysophospholipase L1-like esterase